MNFKSLIIAVLTTTSLCWSSSIYSQDVCETQECQFTGFGDNMRFLWIPGLPGPGNIKYNSTENSLTFDYFSDGTCHIYGDVHNQTHPEYGWYIDVWFSDRMNWNDWSGLERGWKGDESDVQDHFEDWDYYIVDESKVNTLTGTGPYEGSVLELTHKPQNYYYGLQVGVAANDQNAEPGLSCWMHYTGEVWGEELCGDCDINGEGECVEVDLLECVLDVEVTCESDYTPEITGEPVLNCDDYTLNYEDEIIQDCPLMMIRTWTAVNSDGDILSCEQIITAADDEAPVFIDPPEDITVECGNIPEAQIEVSDNCLGTEVEWEVQENEFSGNCFPIIQRTFSAQDACGNIATHVQYITVVDISPPIIANVPENLVLNCGGVIPEFLPEVTDNCSSDLIIEYSENEESIECGHNLEQIWTVIDDCGNFSSVSRIITFIDNALPYLDSPLSDLILGCSEEIPLPEFMDDCEGELQVVVNQNDFVPCLFEQVVEFVVSDQCGNTSNFTQNISFIDELAPVFSGLEEEVYIECGDEPEAPSVVDCTEVSLTFQDESTGDDGCPMFIRTWTAEDECGNSASVEQIVHLIDNQAPEFLNNPLDIITSCSNLSEPDVVIAIDNCDSDVHIEFFEQSQGSDCGLIITRTWIATDDCGNQSTRTQSIELQDETPPTISGETELITSCENNINNLVQVEDDCAAYVELSYVDEILSETTCEVNVVRTYLAIDPCGNSATFTQTLFFIDDTPPSLTGESEISIQCQDDLNTVASPLAEDQCSETSLTFTDQTSSSGCVQTIVRTWIASDLCGNESVLVQNIRVEDTTPPVFANQPSDLYLNCGEFVPPAEDQGAEDNCSSVTVAFSEQTEVGGCLQNYTLMRTWIATDECGNSSQMNQLIHVIDQTPPVFDFQPDDVNAQCGDFIPIPEVSATDECGGEVVIEFSEESSPGGCPNIFRIWKAIDPCGNYSTMIQTVFIEDSEPPVLTGIAPFLNATCDNIPEPPLPNVADNCDENVDVTLSESYSGSGCDQTLTRVWIASDDCGNTTIATQVITLEDTAPPLFINPVPDNAVECEDLESLPLPAVQDDCAGSVQITFEDEQLSFGCDAQILRTYTATDLCGNSSTLTQTIHVIDLSPPLFTGVPASTFVDCGSIPLAVTPVVSDNCNGLQPEIIFTENLLNAGNCSYTIQRIWAATDECGNSTEVSQFIFVADSEPPTFSVEPMDLVIGCEADFPAVEAPEVNDNCSESIDLVFEEISVPTDCGSVLHRVWTATDECGNQSTLNQEIELTDLDAPSISGVPEDVTVDCHSIPVPLGVVVTDECDNAPELSFSEEIITGTCPYQILRTWTAVDNCGNTVSETQTIHVVDDSPPVFLFLPEDMVSTCGDLPEPFDMTAEDNCASDVEIFLTEENGGEGCDRTLIRTWHAEDLCGNRTTHVQTISLVDNLPPIALEFDEEITVECFETPRFEDVEFEDDCSGLEVAWVETLVQGECASVYDLQRLWTATDQCGNSVSVTQTIHVVDTSAPVLSEESMEITVSCEEIPDIPVLSVFGECQEYETEFSEEVEFIEEVDNSCDLGNVESLSGDVSIWLPDLSSSGADFAFGSEPGTFSTDHASGEVSIRGQVYNTNNPNQSWIIDLILYDSQNWTEWSENGGDYKDDLGLVGDNYLDWTYYKLREGSRLIGVGEFEGAELSLTHVPVDFQFGFQLGFGANNKNLEYGISGWFAYEGVLNGEFVFGFGDLIADMKCCPEQDITRTWSVVDCSGNQTVVTQIIHVREDLSLTELELMEIEELSFDVLNTEGPEFVIAFDSGSDTEKTITMTDLSGKVVHTEVYSGLERNTTYIRTVPKDGHLNGIYMFYLKGRTSLSSDKEMNLK